MFRASGVIFVPAEHTSVGLNEILRQLVPKGWMPLRHAYRCHAVLSTLPFLQERRVSFCPIVRSAPYLSVTPPDAAKAMLA